MCFGRRATARWWCRVLSRTAPRTSVDLCATAVSFLCARACCRIRLHRDLCNSLLMPPLGAWAFRYLCRKYADILCSVQGHNVDTLRLEAIHRLLLGDRDSWVQMRFLRQTDAKASHKLRPPNSDGVSGEPMLGQGPTDTVWASSKMRSFAPTYDTIAVDLCRKTPSSILSEAASQAQVVSPPVGAAPQNVRAFSPESFHIFGRERRASCLLDLIQQDARTGGGHEYKEQAALMLPHTRAHTPSLPRHGHLFVDAQATQRRPTRTTCILLITPLEHGSSEPEVDTE